MLIFADMKDYQKIAKEYADEQGCDIVQPTSAERNGYRYFYLTKTVRPRYLGHPHIIRISPTGNVQRVLDVDEIYWAFSRRITIGEQSS
jgi:hypothetical protein